MDVDLSKIPRDFPRSENDWVHDYHIGTILSGIKLPSKENSIDYKKS